MIGIYIGFGYGGKRGSAGTTLLPETQAILDEMTTLPSQVVIDAMDSKIRDSITNGWWAKTDKWFNFSGYSNANGEYWINWKDPAGLKAVPVGTINSFTDGIESSGGGYLRGNFTLTGLANYSLNNASIITCNKTNNRTGSTCDGGIFATSFANILWTPTVVYALINSNTSLFVSYAGTSAGHVAINRTSAPATSFIFNKVSTARSNVSTSIPAGEYHILDRNPTGLASVRRQAYHIVGAFSDEEIQAIQQRYDDFFQEIGEDFFL